MFAIIYDRHGIEQARYTLTDNDQMNPDDYAWRYGRMHGIEMEADKPGARIPDGCEDYRVTIQEDPGSVICWTSRNYMTT